MRSPLFSPASPVESGGSIGGRVKPSRVCRVLVQIEMAESTRWTDEDRFMAVLQSDAEFWSRMLTKGPEPAVTVIKEI